MSACQQTRASWFAGSLSFRRAADKRESPVIPRNGLCRSAIHDRAFDMD